MTIDEMKALQFHPGWDDGRTGFEYCRFDAVIDEARRLRAEVTWDSHLVDGRDRRYYDPILLLESYHDHSDDAPFELEPDAEYSVHLTPERVREVLAAPPADLLRRHASWFASLPPVPQRPAVELRVENHQPVELVPFDQLSWHDGDVVYLDTPYVRERFDSVTSARVPGAKPIGWVVFVNGTPHSADTLAPVDLDRIDCQRTLGRALQPGEVLCVNRTGRAPIRGPSDPSSQ